MHVFFMAIWLILSSSYVLADESLMLTSTNNVSSSTRYISLITDSNDEIDFIRYKAEHADEDPEEDCIITYENLVKGDIGLTGIMKNFLTVKVTNFTKDAGGTISIRYPYNIFTSDMRETTMQLLKENGEWVLYNNQTGLFNHAHVVVRKKIVPLGADQIIYTHKENN